MTQIESKQMERFADRQEKIRARKQAEREERFMPNGVPRYLKVYDNEESADRYTALFTGRSCSRINYRDNQRLYVALAMSANPFHPQGIGQHTEAADGAHLGKRINFTELPDDCRQLVLSDYRAIWNI